MDVSVVYFAFCALTGSDCDIPGAWKVRQILAGVKGRLATFPCY